jgi:TPR repeat protein
MSIPHDQVLEVRSRRPDGRDEVGSGLLLSPRLALTAAHVVFGESRKAAQPILVQLAAKPGEFARARVLWPSRPGKLDAALLEITDPKWHPPERIQTVRWGTITGLADQISCTANGFPRASREPGIGRDTQQFSGLINPGDQLRGHHYDVNITSAVPESPSLWSGMSGAALFAGDLLIGVVTSVPPGFNGAKVTAERASRMAADRAFVAVMRGHDPQWELESVELAGIFKLPRRPSSSQSRARMLDAAAEIVPFRGREQILHELRAWCQARDDFIAGLILGSGGQGKTRLARELCQRLRPEGWVAGFVDDRVSEAAIGHLADTAEPVLLVVDLAETRGAQITKLADVAARRRTGAPAIRMLMLARSAGDWWDQLCRMPDLKAAARVELRELERSNAGRLQAYQEAVRAFADRLSEAEPGISWQDVMSQLPQPDVSDEATASVLTLHMRALTTLLLEAGPSQVETSLGERVEDVLLDYEMQYWAGYELPTPPKVMVLRRCVAAAMLCGATDKEEARALLQLRDVSLPDQDAVADWIHGLYPVPSGRYWGYLQPDRVGEHLIRRVADSEPDFLADVSNAASGDQWNHAITVFARIGGRLEDVKILTEARKWYERAAAEGHNDAAYKLAELWRKDRRPAKARKWYEQAALSGHNDAAYKLAELWRKDDKSAKAKKWYEQAAISGHSDAAFKLGQLLWQGGEPTAARRWFMRAAAADHLDAAYELGWLLRNVEHDHAGAAFWWRMATEGKNGGRTDAAFELAKMLAQDGQPGDVRRWYQHAATFGHTEAAFKLGELLWADGQPDEAKPWYKRAADGKHARAANQLGWLLLRQGDHTGAAFW